MAPGKEVLMKTKWICLLCLLLACLLGGAAVAEDVPAGLQSLLDLTAAASLDRMDQPETIAADGQLSENFVYQLFTLGQKEHAELGLTPAMLNDGAAQAAWLEANYFAEHGPLDGILWIDEGRPAVAVTITRADFSDDGDSCVLFGEMTRGGEPMGLHVRMDARKDAGAACGWKVLLFGLDGVAQEERADALFNEQMIEYISPRLGFSVQYPALFADAAVEQTEGVGGTLKDKSAAFHVFGTDVRGQQGSAETVRQTLEREHPGAVVTVDAVTGMVLASWTENGQVCRYGSYITEDFWWRAEISWDPQIHPELETLSEYMMNSLSVDALGVG